jgi:hypothetical protein
LIILHIRAQRFSIKASKLRVDVDGLAGLDCAGSRLNVAPVKSAIGKCRERGRSGSLACAFASVLTIGALRQKASRHSSIGLIGKMQ